MRNQLLKLRGKGRSTKAERRFAELLKAKHIPFRTKVIIANREVDFLIGKYAIEIDGHPQSVAKNEVLARCGYTPIHLQNREVTSHLNKWLELIFSPPFPPPAT